MSEDKLEFARDEAENLQRELGRTKNLISILVARHVRDVNPKSKLKDDIARVAEYTAQFPENSTLIDVIADKIEEQEQRSLRIVFALYGGKGAEQ